MGTNHRVLLQWVMDGNDEDKLRRISCGAVQTTRIPAVTSDAAIGLLRTGYLVVDEVTRLAAVAFVPSRRKAT